MIKVGKETDYRKIKALNQSMIKLFDTDPVKFFEQFKMGKKIKDKKSTALQLGDLVDFYILECQGDEEEFERRLDEKFSLFQGKKTTAQVFTLADTLFDVTLENMDGDEIKVSFSARFTEACKRVKETGRYSGRSEDFMLKDFNDNGYIYFKNLMDNLGKTVIDEYMISKARRICTGLLNDSFTSGIFSQDLQRKVPIEWKYVTKEGHKINCKSEIDLFLVDDENKKLYLYDLKTTYDNEEFMLGYLKNGYYIQAAFYYIALTNFAQEHYPGYEVVPMQFIVADTSSNNRRPIIYKTTEEDLKRAMEGFTLCNSSYRGLVPLVEDICWAEENDKWNVSRETYTNNGVVKLNLNYGS